MELENNYNLMVGLRIREIREANKMTRLQFSEKCGVSESFLTAVECGKKSISSRTLYKICTAMNTSADYFIRGHENGSEADMLMEKAATMNKGFRESLIRIIREYVDVVCSQTVSEQQNDKEAMAQ